MRTYMYVISRDFGFAPNPFHGLCTLATCKTRIRRMAQVGDWVFGMGGTAVKATGHCIFAMRISRCITFDDYYHDSDYRMKKPVRNGSRIMMVGDNIYHHPDGRSEWHQDDSHHSLPDGSINRANLQHDTKTDRVLISNHYYYFGRSAPSIPDAILAHMKYGNVHDYRVYDVEKGQPLIDWIERRYAGHHNQILADPFHFKQSELRYDLTTDKVG